MKSLSVRQPWASLIASGEKSIEVRSWPTRHRGKLLICASRGAPSPDGKTAMAQRHIQSSNLPRGVALCIVDVVDCRPLTPHDAASACCPYEPEAWAWVLANVELVEPVEIIGRLGLFESPRVLPKTGSQ